MKAHVALHRDIFLKKFFANRSLPKETRKREVYLDESYIHQHYHKCDDSCWDPNDEQDLQIGKRPAKGNCYCFLCAIQGPDPRVFDEQNTYTKEEKEVAKEVLSTLQPKERGGVVEGSVWAFCPQQKKMHKGDYHKVFNAKNFTQWWKDQLLPNLTQPCIIIMDNASYHKAYPDDFPTSSSKKQVFVDFCVAKNIPMEPRDTVPILKDKIKEYKKTQLMLCEMLAKEEGHEVVFQPPHHSDLQPIELLWVKLKGNIGRQYDSNTTMVVLKQCLDEEFAQAMGWHESVEGFIRRTTAIGYEFYQRSMAEETNEDDSSGTEGSSDDSSDSTDDDEIVVVDGEDVAAV
jgi:transposase